MDFPSFDVGSGPLLAKRSRLDMQTGHGEIFMNGSSSKAAFLTLPELIQTLSSEGICLRWDQKLFCFEVLNGPLFEHEVSELQLVHGQRSYHEVGGPFSIMQAYFTLIRGKKWWETGSLFRPKGMDIPLNSDPVLETCDNQGGEYMPATYSITGNRPIDDIGCTHIPSRPSWHQHLSDEEFCAPRPAELREDVPLFQVVH